MSKSNDYYVRSQPKYVALDDEKIKKAKLIHEIKVFRDMLAHSILDMNEDTISRPIEEGISFIEFQIGKPITDEEFEEWEIKVNMVSSDISSLKSLLS